MELEDILESGDKFRLDVDRIGRLLTEIMDRVEKISETDILKQNDILLFDKLISNGIKLQEYADRTKNKKDISNRLVEMALWRRKVQLGAAPRQANYIKDAEESVVGYSLDVERMGRLLNNILTRVERIGESDILKQNDLTLFDRVIANGIRLQDYIETSAAATDVSITALAAKIKERREERCPADKVKMEGIEHPLEALFFIWQFDIKAFAEDIFGLWADPSDDRKGLTKQQADACDSTSRLALYKLKEECLGQAGLTELDFIYVKKHGVAIRSGKGPGKTFITALFCMWMLICFPMSQVVVYSPKEHQTKQGLWKCFRALFRMSATYFELQGDETPLENWILIKEKTIDKLGTNKESKIALGTINASSSPEERGEYVAGQHADYQLIVVDEASNVNERVIQALEDTNTDPLNLLMLISNPTKKTGYFREAFRNYKDYWECIHWNAEESPRVSKSRVEAKAKQYGRDSIEFRVGVLGEFPTTDNWSFIEWDDVQDSIDSISVPLDKATVTMMTIDPSGSGADKTAYTVIRGGRLLDLGYITQDPAKREGIGEIVSKCREHAVDVVVVDANGVGHGAAVRLQEVESYHNFKVEMVKTQKVSSNRERFDRVRDQLWASAREAFREGKIDLSLLAESKYEDLGADLTKQLTRMQAKYDTSARLKVEPKPDFKSREGSSPDLADAFVMYFFVSDDYYEPWANEISQYHEDNDDSDGPINKFSWMG